MNVLNLFLQNIFVFKNLLSSVQTLKVFFFNGAFFKEYIVPQVH